jgi:hypothetical protein
MAGAACFPLLGNWTVEVPEKFPGFDHDEQLFISNINLESNICRKKSIKNAKRSSASFATSALFRG